jgi:xanthine dehydrogenase YagT iron-sulfur-binding subunit
MAVPGHAPAVSRRSFLETAGLSGASLGSVGLGSVAAVAAPDEPPLLGPGEVPIRLTVNGRTADLCVAASATLAEVLRGELDLTGTKIGCDRGACSACTIWLDGAPVVSCMLLAIDVGDRAITTIEGLARGEQLHPVQEAFIAHDAVQCGFCTPGMVMSAAACLERTRHPTEGEVREAISGHVCRCGTYPHAIDATLAAASAGGEDHG